MGVPAGRTSIAAAACALVIGACGGKREKAEGDSEGGSGKERRPVISATRGGDLAVQRVRRALDLAGGGGAELQFRIMYDDAASAAECLAMLDAAERSFDGELRLKARAAAMRRLAELGAYDEAWTRMPEGQGQARNTLVRALFQGMDFDTAIFAEQFARLEFDSEKRGALAGFIDSLGDRESLVGVSFDDLPIGAYDVKGALQDALMKFARVRPGKDWKDASINHGERAFRSNEAIAIAKELAAEGAVEEWVVIQMVRGMHSGEPLAALAALDELVVSGGGRGVDKVRGGVIRELMLTDPEKGIAAIRTLPDEGEHRLVTRAFAEWLKIDMAAAGEWYHANASTLSETQKSEAAGSFVSVASSQGEFDVGREWMKHVTDPARRKQLNDKLWYAQRAEANRQAKIDPVGFLAAVVDGETSHGHDSIQPPFDAWLKQDEEAAMRFYEQKAAVLDERQNGVFAYSIAIRALEQGDIEGAREWGKQIVGPVSARRLAERIAAAEGSRSE